MPNGELIQGGPDLGAVGNSAQMSKGAGGPPQELQSFTVKKGDNGGVIICETYETKPPPGRRPSSFMGGGDYKENPFSPGDGGPATEHLMGLLAEMGIAPVAGPPGPPPPPEELGPPPMEDPMMAMGGPNAGAGGPMGPPPGGGPF